MNKLWYINIISAMIQYSAIETCNSMYEPQKYYAVSQECTLCVPLTWNTRKDKRLSHGVKASQSFPRTKGGRRGLAGMVAQEDSGLIRMFYTLITVVATWVTFVKTHWTCRAPVATQETEIRRIVVRIQPQAKSLWDPISEKKKKKTL
jgi:hypothetical protein